VSTARNFARATARSAARCCSSGARGNPRCSARAAAERALREARALAGVRHPSIQRLHDVLEDQNGPVLVLEPATGESLAARMDREPRLDPELVRRLGCELADALAAVHAAGAVHRDVSEDTVILRADGTTCLTGFRLAKPASLGASTSIQYDPERALATTSERVALPAHAAPEQLGGEAANPRTDIFALGCVLYRALTGQPAPAGGISDGARDPARRLAAGAPQSLVKLVLACLAQSPLGRPQTAAELRDGLRAVAVEPRGAPRARRASRAAILALASLVALCALGWQLWPRRAAPGERGLAPSEAPRRSAEAAFEPGFRSSRALLIGIGEAYRGHGFEPLANSVADVEALAEALEASTADRCRSNSSSRRRPATTASAAR
jgi:hypothetical protein